MDTGRVRDSENRPKILRIFYSIQRQQERGVPLLRRIRHDFVFRRIGLGRYHPHHALVIAEGNQMVKLLARVNLQGNAVDFGEPDDLGILTSAVSKKNFDETA